MEETTRRLDDLVREKLSAPYATPLNRPPFGLETEGELYTAKQSGFHSLEFLYKYRGVTSFASGFTVIITVPRTGTGVAPLREDDQPYRWTGKINEAAAGMAVWQAFELLTEGEARNFMETHHPVVEFHYLENRLLVELRVVYNHARWEIL